MLEMNIDNRLSVFLDTNVWIDMTDEKSEDAKNIKELLTQLVRKGVVFCPLSLSILTELIKQEYDSALRVAKAMQTLSLDFCFAPDKSIFVSEVKCLVDNWLQNEAKNVQKTDVFTHFFEAWELPVNELVVNQVIRPTHTLSLKDVSPSIKAECIFSFADFLLYLQKLENQT